MNARCEEFDVEDKAYIGYILEHGKVMVKPPPGVISREGIVPPDKRFPALIRAFFEDEHLNPLINAEVRFWIAEDSPLGMLRGPAGKEATELTLITISKALRKYNTFLQLKKYLVTWSKKPLK